MARSPTTASGCRFERRVRIDAPAEVVFRWHEQPGAFERLMPPWETAEVLQRPASLQDGQRAVIALRIGPWQLKWIAEHCDYQAGKQFRDVQIRGPFAAWSHLHRITPDGTDACYLHDIIDYAPPFGWIGRWIGGRIIREKLDRLFTYRHRVTKDDILMHHTARSTAATDTLRIAITGATGLIGTALTNFLRAGGHTVCRITRSAQDDGDSETINWQPDKGEIDPKRLEGLNAVIHLAGESIAGLRWSASKKAAIRNSRVESTQLLSETIAKLDKPPKAFLCASAMGFYGDRGDEVLDEDSPPGDTFLARVCKEWEAAADTAREAEIRTVHMRFGIVLSPGGGPLQQMLTPFRLGLGGKVGSGKQHWSWIAIDDAVHAIHHLINHAALAGAVNLVSPNPATNYEFTKTLGRVINRPTVMPLPSFAAKAAFGEMANELMLASAQIHPTRLLESGFEFAHPDLEPALRHLLGK